MDFYLHCELVRAEPALRGGNHGYEILRPGGMIDWLPADEFERRYRRLDGREIELTGFTPAELQMMRIHDTGS